MRQPEDLAASCPLRPGHREFHSQATSAGVHGIGTRLARVCFGRQAMALGDSSQRVAERHAVCFVCPIVLDQTRDLVLGTTTVESTNEVERAVDC
jgi:hypothetical protein